MPEEENKSDLQELVDFANNTLAHLKEMQTYLDTLADPFTHPEFPDYLQGARQNVVHTANKVMDMLRDAMGDKIKESEAPPATP